MKIEEYNKIIGKTIPAEKIGKYHYTLMVDYEPRLNKKELELYYIMYATNIEKEVVEKDIVSISSKITFKNKDQLLLEDELNEFKDKLRKKLLKSQSKHNEIEYLNRSSATLILIENAKRGGKK